MKSRIPGSIFKAFAMVAIVFFVIGFVYPTVSAVISEHVLPGSSDGSQVRINGTVYGSYLLAEAFNSSVFFHPRPSAVDYNLTQSGSYPYSPGNSTTLNITQKDLKQFMNDNPGVNRSRIPYSMVAASASGLDPNIPLQGAVIQVDRIAGALHQLSLSHFNRTGNGSVLKTGSVMQFLNQSVNADKKQNFPLFGSYYVNTVALNFQIISMLMDKGVISQSFLD